MSSIPFIDCIDIVGTSVHDYEGSKLYISTGAVNTNKIDYNQVEEVTYQNRPSRANLVVQEGDVIFAKMQATNKTIYINKKLSRYIFSTGFFAVRAREGVITPSCLYLLLSSEQFLSQKDKYCSGATQKAITNSGLKKISISIPDISIQEKLSKILLMLQSSIVQHKTMMDKYDELIKSRFVEMFGDPEINPRSINIYPWKEIFYTQTGKLDSNEAVINGKYPFFTCSKEPLTINEYAYDCEALLLAGNNAAGIYDVKHYNGKFNAYQRTYILQLQNKEWEYAVFKHQLEDKLLFLQSQSKGTNTRYLTMGILNQLSFLVPPIKLQNQFADFVNKVEKQKATVQKSIDKLETLKKSLMQKYFG